MTKNVFTLWRMLGVIAIATLFGFAALSCRAVYHTVSFDTGSGITIDSVQIPGGQTLAEPSTPTRAGHQFSGWYTSAESTGEPFDFATAITGDMTLHARWTVLRTVTFASNGGSAVAVQQVVDGGNSTEPAAPTRPDHDFSGWYSNAQFTGQPFNFAATAITGNTTLHARWERMVAVHEIGEVTLEMVWIAPGTFTMGQNHGMPDWMGATERQVTLTRGFYMSVHPVTQDQFHAVMGTNPSHFTGNPAQGEVQGRRPVENVNWYHAIAFANRLSILQGLEPVYGIAGMSNTDADAWLFGNVPTGRNAAWDAVTANWNANGFRLPTEAEWEFAARAGTTTEWSFGSDAAYIDDYAWINWNADGMTREVGQLRPNAWGLYDMHGNVFEWVWDWYGPYPDNAQTNPVSAVSGDFRVLRGGAWDFLFQISRSAIRRHTDPDNRFPYIGFRVVRP